MTDEHIKERTDLILAAATRMFARKGVAAATMQDVAAEAGLSVGAIYRYYPGKEQLVRAVFNRIKDNTRSLFAKAAELSDSPADMLRNAGSIIAERFQQAPPARRPYWWWRLSSPMPGNPMNWWRDERQLRDAYTFLTERFFRQAQRNGALDPALDSEGLALLFVSLMVGLHVMSLETQDPLELTSGITVVNEMLLRFAPPEGNGPDEPHDIRPGVGWERWMKFPLEYR